MQLKLYLYPLFLAFGAGPLYGMNQFDSTVNWRMAYNQARVFEAFKEDLLQASQGSLGASRHTPLRLSALMQRVLTMSFDELLAALATEPAFNDQFLVNIVKIPIRYDRPAVRYCLEMAVLAIHYGANVNVRIVDGNEYDSYDDNYTPLIIAARSYQEQIGILLINRGADVHATTQNGTTALMCAAHHGLKELVALLLARGADPLLKTRTPEHVYGGFTAIDFANRYGQTEIAKLLWEQVKKTAQQMLPSANKEDEAVFNEFQHHDMGYMCRFSSRYKNSTEPEFIKQIKDIPYALFLHKTRTDSDFKENFLLAIALSPLCRNAERALFVIQKIFEDSSIHASLMNKMLIRIVENRHMTNKIAIAHWLLAHGADANLQWYNKTLLMWAAEKGWLEMVQLLLDYGADSKIRIYEITALDYAIQSRCCAVIALLQKKREIEATAATDEPGAKRAAVAPEDMEE